MKNATLEGNNEYTEYIKDTYTLSLIIYKMIAIFELLYEGFYKINEDIIINTTYHKLKELYSQIINKYIDKKEYGLRDTVIDSMPIDISDTNNELWWNDYETERLIIKQRDLWLLEMSKYLMSGNNLLPLDYLETTSNGFEMDFNRFNKHLKKLLEIKSEKENNLQNKNNIKERIVLEIIKDSGTIKRLENDKYHSFRGPIKNNKRFNFILKIINKNTSGVELGKNLGLVSNEIKEINKKLRSSLNLSCDFIINKGNSGYEINKEEYTVKII